MTDSTRVPHSVGEEERNIPLRVCLTRNEWDTLSAWLPEGEVYQIVEALIVAVVADERLLQGVKEAIES